MSKVGAFRGLGLLAKDGETPVGALCCASGSGDENGYGYVSPQIPELSIALLPGYRKLGLGTRMLSTAISMACLRYPGLSLSVECSPLGACTSVGGFVSS